MRLSGLFWAGTVTGAVNGLFGTGGGMVLVPLLTRYSDLDEEAVFPSSVCIIFPICIIALLLSNQVDTLNWQTILTYLSASAVGGFLAGKYGKKIPVLWLHRILGLLILWGGFRNLC